jgi:aerobic-type carbon monoxide dehydrogenase small subunit (CoxS/CutS family)
VTVTERFPLSLVLNGERVEAVVEPRQLLVDFLREDRGLTATKIGCEDGTCGTCTVLLDGRAIRSCLIFAVQAGECLVETLEGLDRNGKLSTLQDAFRAHHALQCGYCAAGILVTSYEFLREEMKVSEASTREALSGLICRCTGYHNIVQAVLASDESEQ